MFPLRDNVPSKRFPLVNTLIIIANFAAFFYQLSLGPTLERFIYSAGLVPRFVQTAYEGGNIPLMEVVAPFFSYMFLHGGWLHILSNMWMLWIFGDNIEDRLGKFRYLVFYIGMGLFSGLFHLLTNVGSIVPTIGASGAIAGVMGAYIVLYPRARVLTLVPILIFFQFIELPAFIFLGIWFLMQFLSGTASLFGPNMGGGIAWWAHIGGFVAGIYMIRLFLPNRK